MLSKDGTSYIHNLHIQFESNPDIENKGLLSLNGLMAPHAAASTAAAASKKQCPLVDGAACLKLKAALSSDHLHRKQQSRQAMVLRLHNVWLAIV